MIELTMAELAEIVGGRLRGVDPQATVGSSVEFDSRLISDGGLFLALPGEHVDGHDYAAAAVENGAVAVIATREVDAPAVLVQDGFQALAALAAALVRRLPQTTVIGVTGSSGKTSTKDLLAHVLSRHGATVAPPGSFNNELGHPYTVLRADEHTRYLVLETSARGLGHIRYLTEIAPPRIGVVLNVGSAHLGEFGSRETIAQAKGELVEALPADGLAVLNADDPLVARMSTRTRARVLSFGQQSDAAIRAGDVVLDELGRASFTLSAPAAGERPSDLEQVRVQLRLTGAHHVGNALAAAAVALECGMSLTDVADALGSATAASRWRMEVHERADGVVVINDAYNANPESMRAALETLATLVRARKQAGARAFAVLGEMAELGEQGPVEHENLGRRAARLGLSRVVAVGEAAGPIHRGATAEDGWHGRASSVSDGDAALALLRDELRPADVVLVKASRAARLERLALALVDDHTIDHRQAGETDPERQAPRDGGESG